MTDDEYTILEIASHGNSMLAVGRWEKPVKDLTARGLLNKLDEANYVITPAGREVFAERDRENDQALADVINASRSVARLQRTTQDFIEQAAKILADSAKAASQVTGDDPKVAVRKWTDVMIKRTLELL